MQARDAFVVFAILFALTLYFCLKADDDVVYNFFDRKPTGQESIRRIRYVFSKMLCSVYGGGILAIIIKKNFFDKYSSFNFLQNKSVFVILLFAIIFRGMFGAIQNIIILL